MIFGSYPCCNGDLCLSMPDNAGYAPEDCPHCGARVWHHFSRIEPETYLEADFMEKYEIDEEAHTIKLRNAPPPLSPEAQAFMDKWMEDAAEKISKQISDALIYGTGVCGHGLVDIFAKDDDIKH